MEKELKSLIEFLETEKQKSSKLGIEGVSTDDELSRIISPESQNSYKSFKRGEASGIEKAISCIKYTFQLDEFKSTDK